MRRSFALLAISGLLPIVALSAVLGTVAFRDQRHAAEERAHAHTQFAATLVALGYSQRNERRLDRLLNAVEDRMAARAFVRSAREIPAGIKWDEYRSVLRSAAHEERLGRHIATVFGIPTPVDVEQQVIVRHEDQTLTALVAHMGVSVTT